MLFVNLGGRRNPRYRNDILKDNGVVTFDFGGSEPCPSKPLVLFARFQKENFLYLGRVEECGVRMGRKGEEVSGARRRRRSDEQWAVGGC